jgi:MarR family transcriptional regulator, negative regulator of the multidrug operon emrRAB
MSLLEQIAAIESGLAHLSKHIPDLPQTEVLASRLLIHLGREMTSRLDQRLRPHGLGEIEFRTLMGVYVHTRDELSAYPGELCSSLGQSPANMTRLTDSLVQRGLIERLPDEQDRRKLGLRTTTEGNLLVNALLPVMLDSARQNYTALSQSDLQELVQILKKLAAVLDQQSASAETST